MSTYRQEIIERYRFPRHRGELFPADRQGEVINDLCGDELSLFLKLTEDREVIDAKFQGEGCALMVVSADILCDYIIGKEKEQLTAFTSQKMLDLYGELPSPSRFKCVLLPREALHYALK